MSEKDFQQPGDFSSFVRLLDSASRTPDEHCLGRVWTALRKAVQSEIKRRGLWGSPPEYLGVDGWASWSQTVPGREAAGRHSDDALQELASDCYVYIFVTRFQNLKAQLRIKPTIEGLVFRNIRNFLYERQKHHDPVGFRVFRDLRIAVRRAVETGSMSILCGSPAIRNDTVLAFARSSNPSGSSDPELFELVAVWADDLLPELMQARGKARQAMLVRLGEHLRGLRDAGVGSFQFKQLVDVLKSEVRRRWEAMFRETLGEPAADGLRQVIRIVLPDTECEERESFERLVECVDQRLEQLEVKGRTHDYLSGLWRFLKSYAATADPRANGLPSRRRIARELKIPRERLPGLYDTLGELIRASGASRGRSRSEKPAARVPK